MDPQRTKSARSSINLHAPVSPGTKVSDDKEDTPRTFEEFLSTACKKFQCPFNVVVQKEFIKDDYKPVSAAGGQKKGRRLSFSSAFKKNEETLADTRETSASTVRFKSPIIYEEDTIFVTSKYDLLDRLVELSLFKVPEVPRVLIQLIGRLAPYSRLLTKFCFRRCGINSYTIYEIAKALPMTYLNEIFIDSCPIPEANYALLVDVPSYLKHLTLTNCKINDEVCKLIAAKLRYPESSAKRMLLLNLSSNHIGDEGAKCLGEALRTNRRLRYLNLSGNHISDIGAAAIFNALIEFPLTHEEVLKKREHLMEYLREKTRLLNKYQSEICYDSKSVEESRRSPKTAKKSSISSMRFKQGSGKKGKEEELTWRDKVQSMVNDIMGPYDDPFSSTWVTLKDDYSFCRGNFVLCYLNFSYNNLTFISLLKLLEVLTYQNSKLRSKESGLMVIPLDGNNLPISCDEMTSIHYFLLTNVSRLGGKSIVDFGRPRSTRSMRSQI